jgi:hypothetical protein
MTKKRAQVTIEGTRIMLWHTFPLDTLSMDKREKTVIRLQYLLAKRRF